MNEYETIADIIAWLRRPSEGENAYLTAWRNEIADRFEAAIKREKAAIEADALTVGGIVEAAHKSERGNIAALREALKAIARLCTGLMITGDSVFWRIKDMTEDALAATPRNCDRYSHDEALQVWASEKENESNGCFDEWLYEIAKEGGAK